MNLGAARPEPWLAAVFEGSGALLWWNVETRASGGEIWDDARADVWIRAPRVTAFARAAALASWREAWWPASEIAGIPPLDPRLLAAERAVALAALDGVTDDDRAAARAFADLAFWTAQLGPLDELDGSVFEEAGVVVPADLARLADGYGVGLADAPAPRPHDYALAAAGRAPAAALASGSGPVDPGAVPQGAVDAFARIEWRLTATMTLEVEVGAAPVIGPPPSVALAARVGPVEVPLSRAAGVWTGRVENAGGLLALPEQQRAVRLVAEGFDPLPGVRPETLRRIAQDWS